MLFRVLLPVLFLFATGAMTAPANADLRICNDTSDMVGVAVGYRTDVTWITEGWWRIPGETCAVVIEGDLTSRYIYLNAEDASGRERWLGRVFMCTSPKEFKITGLQDCFARGYDRTGFFEVDTGQQKSWQVRLSDIGSNADDGRTSDARDDAVRPDITTDTPAQSAGASQPETN